MANASQTPGAPTVDPAESAKFNALAAGWWDPKGASAPLHAMNPARLAVIRDQLCSHFGREAQSLRSLAGLDVLDLGCGAGLVAEPLARLGAAVTAIDAAADAIAVATAHAAQSGLMIGYRCAAPEALVADGRTFDAVVSLEVVEHVADVPAYLAAIRALLRPGGMAILSTLNRTPQSWLTAIVGAEYVARLLPRGTHDWQKFLTPAELAVAMRAAGLEPGAPTGLGFDPLKGAWHVSSRTDVNYMLAAAVPAVIQKHI
jgi:2-polyprenyl-6-hydroxyphenyl methylase / 3-demethylubiquinone-9 3-methyltransferase